MDWVDYIGKLASIGAKIAQTRVPSCTQQRGKQPTHAQNELEDAQNEVQNQLVHGCSQLIRQLVQLNDT